MIFLVIFLIALFQDLNWTTLKYRFFQVKAYISNSFWLMGMLTSRWIFYKPHELSNWCTRLFPSHDLDLEHSCFESPKRNRKRSNCESKPPWSVPTSCGYIGRSRIGWCFWFLVNYQPGKLTGLFWERREALSSLITITANVRLWQIVS